MKETKAEQLEREKDEAAKKRQTARSARAREATKTAEARATGLQEVLKQIAEKASSCAAGTHAAFRDGLETCAAMANAGLEDNVE